MVTDMRIDQEISAKPKSTTLLRREFRSSCGYHCPSYAAIIVDIGCCKAKESLMTNNIHMASVDIDCIAEEARKLFIFVSYMAELQSGSLRSCDCNSKMMYVCHFIESINAYVRSDYLPLHILKLKGVVVC